MDKYLETRNQIRLLFDKQQYIKCIATSTSFLEELKQEDEHDIEVRYNLWFVNKRLSNIYCKFKKFDDAMTHCRIAMKYQNSDLEYYLTIWLLALIQETTNKKRAIKLYDKCIWYFSRTKQTDYMASVVRNKQALIALSNNDIKQLFWIQNINTFNNTTNIIEYIHSNTYNIALNIIDKLIDLTSYGVALVTL